MAGKHPRTAEPDRARSSLVSGFGVAGSPAIPSSSHDASPGWREDSNLGGSRTYTYPGIAERNRLGHLRTERRGRTTGNQPLHSSIPHEEAWNRPPGRDMG